MAIKHRNRIILGIGLGMLIAVVVAGYFPMAHPFSGFKSKTLWDWLSLAGVPLVLALFGFRLQLQQQQQTKEQLETEQGIAEQNRQEEALENYFDKVSALLVEKNLLAISAKGDTTTPEERELLDVSVDVIRARTLTTLRKLDSSRKTSLIRFLLESEVITKLKLSLERADLEGADLSKGNLEGSNLSEANLKRAYLRKANLKGAYLEGVNLKEAYLVGANLEGAILDGSHMPEVNLSFANLEEASLWGAHLEGADLSGAILRSADLGAVFSKEQLEGEYPPYLCHTILPEDIDIDPNRDCERLERDFSSSYKFKRY